MSETTTNEIAAPASPRKRQTKVAKMEETLRELTGRPVRLTVQFNIRGKKQEPEQLVGLLLAVGTKMGPWEGFTTPTCAVVRPADGLVKIVSARSITEAVQDKPTPA